MLIVLVGFFFLLSLSLLLLFLFLTFSIGGDIFLKGLYIEVGIHNVGSYGTSVGAPAGFVSAGARLGFIADYDKNGFTSSSPGYAGDFFVPGAPVEG